MDDTARIRKLEKLVQTARRLHALAAHLDPDDPELATIEDSLDEAQQAIMELKDITDDDEDEGL